MNFIIYQDNGVLNSIYRNLYSPIDNRLNLIFHLARSLGVSKVLDGTPSIYQEVPCGTILSYTLDHYSEYNFRSSKFDEITNSIGIICPTKDSTHINLRKWITSTKLSIVFDNEILNNLDEELFKFYSSRVRLFIVDNQERGIQLYKLFKRPSIVLKEYPNEFIPRVRFDKIYDEIDPSWIQEKYLPIDLQLSIAGSCRLIDSEYLNKYIRIYLKELKDITDYKLIRKSLNILVNYVKDITTI